MNEIMCRTCLVIKERVPKEVIEVGEKRLFTNSRGQRWHGRQCPDCFLKDASKRNKIYKAARKKGTYVKVTNPFTRFCRVCGSGLPTDRYFKHKTCDAAYKATFYMQGDSVWTPEDWGCSINLPGGAF